MSLKEDLKHKSSVFAVFYIVLALLCIFIVLAGINLGAMKVSAYDVMRIVMSKLTGSEQLRGGIADNVTAVVWEIRIPRILCGMFTGAGLAAAGVIFQGILQNPLADPYTLGISTGASFGASVAIYISIVTGMYMPVTGFALAAALATLAAVTAIAGKGSSFESNDLIIAGIIASSVLSSGVSLLKMLSGENVSAIVFWIMGNISSCDWSDAALICPVVTAAVIIASIFSKQLDIMSLGDRNAAAIGVNTKRIRLIYLVIGSVITAVCVSVCGVIGFVGLIVPHLLRFRLSSKNSVLIPASALTGAALLSLADNVTRLLPGGEIPVGIITTLVGGPFFIYIFMRRRRV